MFSGREGPEPTTLLAGAALGVYLLVVAGATAALAAAARACPGWPVCDASLARPEVVVALGHRALALVVGALVLATAVAVFRADTSRRVRAATAAAAVLFPVQMLVGALLATSAGAAPLPGIHLAVGLAIFAALVLGLAWRLEAETGSDARETGAELLDASGPAVGERAGSASAPAKADEEAAESAAGAGTPLRERSFGGRLRRRVLAYVRLTKPRLMWLLCLVAAAGMALAAGPALTVETVLLTLSGGVLAIGASGTFNHVLERDRDQRMARTADRPVATHQIPARRAAVFGVVLAAASLGIFLHVNLLAAGLGLVAILFYSVVYTLLLKPNTVQNTVIGGAAGALPALIGWAAVTGDLGVPGLALAGLVFVWTPAHFYNLALAYKEDYARGGFPMMPVVRGDRETRKHILLWLGATLAAAGSLIWVADLGVVVAGATVCLGAVFLWAVLGLHRERTEAAAFRAFHASNAYLGAVLVAVVVDALVL
jgi:protoheme IX farnesyltransferase